MQNLVRRKKFLESPGGSKQASQALLFRDTKIEDLCLDFTLPGYPDYVLKPDGQSIMVMINFALYCSYMLKNSLYTNSYIACTNCVGKPRDARRVCKSCCWCHCQRRDFCPNGCISVWIQWGLLYRFFISLFNGMQSHIWSCFILSTFSIWCRRFHTQTPAFYRLRKETMEIVSWW
jgi:hypothetical protein